MLKFDNRRLIVVIVNRNDGGATESIKVLLHDDSATAILGLWGTAARSVLGKRTSASSRTTNPDSSSLEQGWRTEETVLLLEAPGIRLSPTVSCKS